jgi:hypothetical protein
MSNSSTYLKEQLGLTHLVEITERGMAVNTAIKAALTVTGASRRARTVTEFQRILNQDSTGVECLGSWGSTRILGTEIT